MKPVNCLQSISAMQKGSPPNIIMTDAASSDTPITTVCRMVTAESTLGACVTPRIAVVWEGEKFKHGKNRLRRKTISMHTRCHLKHNFSGCVRHDRGSVHGGHRRKKPHVAKARRGTGVQSLRFLTAPV